MDPVKPIIPVHEVLVDVNLLANELKDDALTQLENPRFES